MPRKNPTKKIDVIGHLDRRPENAINDYISSKQQKDYFIGAPNWDSAGESIEMIYIQNKRDYMNMLELQEKVLQNSIKQKKLNKIRLEHISKDQTELRKQFIEINNFIQQCSQKMLLAENQFMVQSKTQQKLREDIVALKFSLDELTIFHNNLKEIVNEFEPYESIMENVVKESGTFASVEDFMNRCDALMMAQTEITRLEEQKMLEIEDMLKKMGKMTNESPLTVLGLKNELNHVLYTYHQAFNECILWEKLLQKAKDEIALQNLNKECTLDGIHQLYKMLCTRLNIEPPFEKIDIEEQLDFIKSEVDVLRNVLKECESYPKEKK